MAGEGAKGVMTDVGTPVSKRESRLGGLAVVSLARDEGVGGHETTGCAGTSGENNMAQNTTIPGTDAFSQAWQKSLIALEIGCCTTLQYAAE